MTCPQPTAKKIAVENQRGYGFSVIGSLTVLLFQWPNMDLRPCPTKLLWEFFVGHARNVKAIQVDHLMPFVHVNSFWNHLERF